MLFSILVFAWLYAKSVWLITFIFSHTLCLIMLHYDSNYGANFQFSTFIWLICQSNLPVSHVHFGDEFPYIPYTFWWWGFLYSKQRSLSCSLCNTSTLWCCVFWISHARIVLFHTNFDESFGMTCRFWWWVSLLSHTLLVTSLPLSHAHFWWWIFLYHIHIVVISLPVILNTFWWWVILYCMHIFKRFLNLSNHYCFYSRSMALQNCVLPGMFGCSGMSVK